MPFEALGEPARLGGGEGFVERGGLVGVEIVLHQHDLRRVGKMHVRQIPERMGIIDGGVAVGHFHMPPPFQRGEHHEQIGDAIAFVFVIVTRLASRLRGDRRARLDDQLLRGFVEAHERTLRIVRPLIDLQHVFHVGHKGRAGVRRDHPLLLAMRFENVFFSVRPIVLSLARSTICSSTTFSSSRRRLQPAKPSGAVASVSSINFASAAPSKIRRRAALPLYLRLNTTSNPSSTSWRLVRSIVAMLVSSAAAIRLSLQPSPSSDTSAFSRMRAFVSRWAERLPLRINSSSLACSSALNRTPYFLTAISFPTTNHLHRCLAATEIQKLPSFSMTGATSTRFHDVLPSAPSGRLKTQSPCNISATSTRRPSRAERTPARTTASDLVAYSPPTSCWPRPRVAAANSSSSSTSVSFLAHCTVTGSFSPRLRKRSPLCKSK